MTSVIFIFECIFMFRLITIIFILFYLTFISNITVNKSWLISTSMSLNVSIVSKKFLKCSRTSSSSSIQCNVSCFNEVAFRAGPLDWEIDLSFNHASFDVIQPLICINSDGFIEKIISDRAFFWLYYQSFPAAAVAVSARMISGLTLCPFTKSHVSFFIRRVSTRIFQVS